MDTVPTSDPDRILVRGVNWLGDAVMSTPAVLRLRERFPSARIALLTQGKLAGLWADHPAIDEVISFQPGEGVWAVARRLRSLRFDLAVILPNSPRSAMEAFFARIPRRVGGRWPWRNWMLTDVVEAHPGAVAMRRRDPAEIAAVLSRPKAPAHWGEPLPGPAAHHIHQYLRLLRPLGGCVDPLPPSIGVNPRVLSETRARFEIDPSRGWIGINAGAEYGAAKRWPAESFRALVAQWVRRPDLGILLFGGPADVALAESLVPSDPRQVRVLAGKTTLPQLAAGLKCCAVVVTNDTGPMHLAAAVGTPVLVLFGSTSPELTGPGLPGDPRHRFLRHEVACSPCFLRECPANLQCLRGIPPERVLAELGKMNLKWATTE